MRSKQQQQHHRSKFLPMLCSSTTTATKEVNEPSHRRCSSSSSSTLASVSEDPSSPRVGCMGQVKRNNKVVGFPSIISFTTSFSGTTSNSKKTEYQHQQSSNAVKYHNLRNFFSSRNLTNNSPTNRGGTHKSKATSAVSNRASETDHHHPGISSRRICRSASSSMIHQKDDTNAYSGSDVNLEEMDPPLPVVKLQVQKQKEEEGSLWKRRSGGVALKSLQVKTCNLPSANTV